MLYELQILRNNEPCKDKAEAIQNLDNFAHHLIGQPCSILYNDGGKVKILFAVGKKNYGTQDYTIPSSENYEIINSFVDNTIYWEKFNEDLDALINTQDKVKFCFANIDDFNDNIDLIGDEMVSFVTSDNGIRKIYKGNQTYATNDILSLVASEAVEELGIEEGDTFIDIIENLKDTLKDNSLKWNDDSIFKLYETTEGVWRDTTRDLEADERSFFEVDLTDKYEDAAVKAHYINKEQIGNAYISHLTDIYKQMPYNVGEFTRGMTLGEVYQLSGHDKNTIIDKILFPKELHLNYGIITEEQIKSLFNGTAGPYDPSEDDDEHEHVSDHILISQASIKDMIKNLDNNIEEPTE